MLLDVVRRTRHCSRHLAVNNGVRRQTADSDALRSVGVPNLKTRDSSVAFWHKSRRAKPVQQRVQSPSNHAGCLTRGSRQPITVASTATAGFMIAPLAVDDSGRRTAADTCRCDLRKAPPPAVPAAVRRCHRIVPAAFPALPSDRSPPLRYARPCVPSPLQAVHAPVESNHNAGNEVSVWYRPALLPRSAAHCRDAHLEWDFDDRDRLFSLCWRRSRLAC